MVPALQTFPYDMEQSRRCLLYTSENASATNISSNTVNKPGINGIFIYNNSNVDLITDNNISAGNVNITLTEAQSLK